jgi:hypothetical protein
VVEALERGGPGAGASPTGQDPSQVLTTELVRAYLARTPRRGPDRVEVAWSADAVDVLSRLRPRERAAAVLRLVDAWSPEQAARALRTRPGRLASLVPTTDGLATALESLADQHARPPHEVVATILAALPHGADGPADGPTGPRRPHRHRRLRRVAGVTVTLAALAAGAASVLLDDPDQRDPTTDAHRSASEAWSATPDLALRGWVLDAEDEPPRNHEGMRLVESTRIDYANATEPLMLDTQPRTGWAVYGVLWCDIPALDDNLAVPAVTLRMSRGSVTIPCAGRQGVPAVRRLVPLPSTWDAGGKVPVEVSWSGDLPGRGSAVLATYSESGQWLPSSRAVTSDPPPPVPDGAVVVDSASPVSQVEFVPAHLQRLRVTTDTRVGVWGGQGGAISVLVDGVPVTDDGEAGWWRSGMFSPDGQEWQGQDAELRDGRWLVHRPGSTREFALPEALGLRPGEEREVTLHVTTEGLEADRWQVHAAAAEAVDVDLSPVRPVATDAPVHLAGRRLVHAWEVPADGFPHPLVVPPGAPLTHETVYAAVLPPDPDTPTGGWPGPGTVSSALGQSYLPTVYDVTEAFGWQDGGPGWSQDLSGRPQTAGASDQLGEVSVSLLGFAGSSRAATVLAYEAVPYEEFDFAAAPPGAASVPVGQRGAGDSLANPGAAFGSWTRADLDDDGRLVLDDLPVDAYLLLTTEGKGRVRVLEDDRPVEWLRDGWWSSWTLEAVVSELQLAGTSGYVRPGQSVELVVEGYDERFEVELHSWSVGG